MGTFLYCLSSVELLNVGLRNIVKMQMLIGKNISLSCLYCAVEEAPSAAPRPHGGFACNSTPPFLRSLGFQSTFFFFFPCSQDMLIHWSKISLLVWEKKMPFPGFHMPGVFNPCSISFSVLYSDCPPQSCLSLASLNKIPSVAVKLRGNCMLELKKIILSMEEDSKIMFYVKLKHPSWFPAHHNSEFLLLESKSLIVSNHCFLTLKQLNFTTSLGFQFKKVQVKK